MRLAFCAVILVVAGAFSTGLHAASPRKWTSSTGSQVTAYLLRADAKNETLTLLTTDDRKIALSLDKLAPKDQEFIRQVARSSAEAELAMQSGLKSLKAGLYPAAYAQFEKARKLDPYQIKASFGLGLMAIGLNHDPEEAFKFFSDCQNRWKFKLAHLDDLEKANYAAVLNNLALFSIRNRRVSRAIGFWRKANDLLPETPQEMIQNLGTLNEIGSTHLRQVGPADIPIRSGDMKAIQSLLTETKAGVGAKQYESGTGWVYMTYAASPPANDQGGQDQDGTIVKVPSEPSTSSKPVLVKVGSGSGFVVADGYVLTNRHCVLSDNENQRAPFDGFMVFDGPTYKSGRTGKLVAYDKLYDIALLRVEGLKAKPIPIYGETAPLGTEVNSLGFPAGAEYGVALTVTSGALSRHPVKVDRSDKFWSQKSSFWHDAMINSGNSGGPLMARSGVAVGVNFADFKPRGELENRVMIAVPSNVAVAFLKTNIPGFKGANSLDGMGVADVQDSVVYIEMSKDALFTEVPRKKNASSGSSSSPFVDRACIACSGRQILECPNRKCKNGVIRGIRQEIQTRYVGGRAFDFVAKIPTRDKCSVCDGKGLLDCPFSASGIDKRFIPD